MKKITKKLSLNKETLATLDNAEMRSIKGGITYSLSTGAVCQSNNNPSGCSTVGGACTGSRCNAAN